MRQQHELISKIGAVGVPASGVTQPVLAQQHTSSSTPAYVLLLAWLIDARHINKASAHNKTLMLITAAS